MKNDRLLEQAREEYSRSLKENIFVLPDLLIATLSGCNWVTGGKQHDKANLIAQEYVKYKDKSLVYTLTDIEIAFSYGVKSMAKIIDKENEKIKLSMTIKAEKMQKAMKLICAGQQMLDLANTFSKEAQGLLSKDGVVQTEIRNNFTILSNMMRKTNASVGKVFKTFTVNEAYEWAEDADKLEESVREIYKIDIYEPMTLKV